MKKKKREEKPEALFTWCSFGEVVQLLQRFSNSTKGIDNFQEVSSSPDRPSTLFLRSSTAIYLNTRQLEWVGNRDQLLSYPNHSRKDQFNMIASKEDLGR